MIEIEDENKKVKILYDNLPAIFRKEIDKLTKFNQEIKEDLLALSSKLNLTVDKAENSFQQYELLYYEVGTIKKSLLSTAKKITTKILSSILLIKNPNEAIYLLMKMFFRIIKSETEIIDTNKNNNDSIDPSQINWEYLQSKINYKLFKTYITLISETNCKGLSKEELDDAMPFLVNYEKLTELFVKFGNGLQIILDFIKIIVDYNIKLNIIKNLYESNLNKNNKINAIQNEVNTLSTLAKRTSECLTKMENDSKITKGMTHTRVSILNLIVKYNIHNRYNVLIEVHSNSNFKQKYIIRLKSKFKERDAFLTEIISSVANYEEGKVKNFDKKKANTILNSSSDKNSYIIDNSTTKNRNGFNYYYPKNLFNKLISCSRYGNTTDNLRSYGSTGYKESGDEEDTTNVAKTTSKIKIMPIDKAKLEGIKAEEMNSNNNVDRTKRTKVTTDRENETNRYTSREMSHRNYIENNNKEIYNTVEYKIVNNEKSNPRPIVRKRGCSAGKAPLKIESSKIEFNSYYCCKF